VLSLHNVSHVLSHLAKLEPLLTVGRSEPNSIKCDLSGDIPALPDGLEHVIHCAGKAHSTPKSIEEENEFFRVNLDGTKNLVEGIERSSSAVKSFIFISTVAVYGRQEGCNLSESTPLNGSSPYAKSKIEAERFLEDWSFNRRIQMLILRLPLVAASNPPGNLGAMIDGIRTGRYFSINRGKAKKSMVLASDIAHLVMNSNGQAGIYNLTDRYHPRVSELEEVISRQLKRPPPFNIPLPFAKLFGICGDVLGGWFPVNTPKVTTLTKNLVFNDDKAVKELGWKPKRVIDHLNVESD
jgi:nucleoside-diphosphate-sugar epimerase